MTEPKMFRLMETGRLIPWEITEEAYEVYAAKYGRGQTLERIQERGGFAPSEMDALLPGWRDKVSESARLRARIDALEEELKETRRDRDNLWEQVQDKQSKADIRLEERLVEKDKEIGALRGIIEREFRWFLNGRYVQWAFGGDPKDEKLYMFVGEAIDAAVARWKEEGLKT